MQLKRYLELEKWYDSVGKEEVYKLISSWRGEIPFNMDVFYIFSCALFDQEDYKKTIKDYNSLGILFDRISKEYKNYIEDVKEKFSSKELESIVLNFSKSRYFERPGSMPGFYIQKGLRDLVYKLLDISAGDKLLQPYSMEGDFIADFLVNYPDSTISSIEMKTDYVLNSQIKTSVISYANRANINQGNFLDVDLDEYDYNKFFSMPPMGVRYKELECITEDKELLNLYRTNGFDVYDDWINILKITLKSDFEKGIFIVPSGLLFNERSKQIRKYMLDEGLIEGVIELAPRLFMGTSISTNILLISKNNKTIKMVDASELYTKDRLINTISEENVQDIFRVYQVDSDISKTVTLDKIEENNYSLLSKRYTAEELDLEEYVYLKDIADIKRGHANLRQSELAERLSDENTQIKILTAGDIDDEFYIGNLSSLKNLDESEEAYCLKDGDIAFARGGNYKSILIRNSNDNKIVANGTLYIITCNNDMIDPYFLQMYLSSDHCRSQIESLNSGTAIHFMSIKQLGELKIPKVPKNFEEEISSKYRTLLDRKEVIRIQKIKLEEDINELISEVI